MKDWTTAAGLGEQSEFGPYFRQHSLSPKTKQSRGFQLSILGLACILLAGCTTRSISHSGYHDADVSCYVSPSNNSRAGFGYRGELSEFDVLGISRGEVVSEAEIHQALAGARRLKLQPGDSILLIQSGATFPDGVMVSELSKHFRIVPFSGIPNSRGEPADQHSARHDAESYSRSLRLAAARGGNDAILCYWGILESENAGLPTKTVSWVPVVNWIVPDEMEHMRIRLKLALVDVRTGNWSIFSPPPIEAAKASWSPRRAVADQKLVEDLKDTAYEAAAKELFDRCILTASVR